MKEIKGTGLLLIFDGAGVYTSSLLIAASKEYTQGVKVIASNSFAVGKPKGGIDLRIHAYKEGGDLIFDNTTNNSRVYLRCRYIYIAA